MRLTKSDYTSTRVRSKQVVDCKAVGTMTEVTLSTGQSLTVYESLDYIMGLVNKYRAKK